MTPRAAINSISVNPPSEGRPRRSFRTSVLRLFIRPFPVGFDEEALALEMPAHRYQPPVHVATELMFPKTVLFPRSVDGLFACWLTQK